MTDVDAFVERARAALAVGNPLVARGYWRRASRLAPDRLDIWVDLCKVTELPADRIKCLERITELDPGNTEAQFELAQLRAAQERSKQPEPQRTEPQQGPSINPGAETSVSHAEEIGAAMRPGITDEMRRQWDEAIATGKPLVCINHPQRETSLRCNRCGAPICMKCAKRTPVGFRCAECVKAQQAAFYTVRWYDYPVAAFIALLLSVPAGFLAGMAGWWFALIISPIAGAIIGGAVHRAVGRRRGPWIWLAVGVCIVLGALVALIASPRALIALGVFAVMATASAIGVLRLGR
jgi:hypothetical protein